MGNLPAQSIDLTRNAPKLLRFVAAAYDASDSPVVHLREFMRRAMEQVGGPWWKQTHDPNTRTAMQRRPYLPLGEMVRTYFPHLLGDSILPIVEPAGVGSRGDANLLQARLRQWCDDARYAREDETAVLSALLACSVQYVSRREGGQALATEESTVDMGQPSVQTLSLDRLLIDPYVTDDWEDGVAMGHWFEVDRQALLEAGIGDPDLLMKIPNAWKDQKETRGKDSKSKNEDQYLDDKIILWEMCFRHKGRMFCCTLPPMDGASDFVVPPYPIDNEPEGSRYVVTMLNRLPFSPYPLSPAQCMMDAHLATAAAAAKLTQQIEELERKYVGEPGTQETMMRLQKKGGDQFLTAKGKIQEFIRGGMVEDLLKGFAFLKELGRGIGPNIELAGGRDDPSNSATVGAAMVGNAAVGFGCWKKEIDGSRTRILRRVAALLLQGGDRREMTFETAAGPVPVIWDAAALDVSFDQFKYRIKPTSAEAGMDPRAKLRSLVEVLTTLPPVLQFMSGMLGADPSKVLRVISDLAAMPELDEMLPSGDSAALQMQIFQWLQQSGQAKPAGGASPMGGGMPQMAGRGGMQMPQLPAAGPQTGVGQLNSNLARGVPA